MKTFSLSANHGGVFMGSMYVPICPQNRWLRHCNAIKKHSYAVQEEDIIKRYYIIDINKTIYSFFFTFIEISIKKKLKYEGYPFLLLLLRFLFTKRMDWGYRFPTFYTSSLHLFYCNNIMLFNCV